MITSNLAQELTLPLIENGPPFALTGCEPGFGPEDWAWLFLRLNDDYIKAYKDAQSGPASQQITRYLVDETRSLDVRPDIEGVCKSRFGLSTWLNPELKHLPALKNNGSWFFPLTRLGPSPLPLSSTQSQLNKGPVSIGALDDAEPHLLAQESPFGYQALRASLLLTPPQHFAMLNRSWVLAIVNCSVPVAGQISALLKLARVKRKYLTSRGKLTEDHHRQIYTAVLDEWSTYLGTMAERFSNPASPGNVAPIHAAPQPDWQAIAVDSLGPIMLQIKQIRVKLVEAHRSNVIYGRALPQPIPGSLPKTLPNRTINGTETTGGNYLKALLSVAELHRLYGRPNPPDVGQIMASIPMNGSRMSLGNVWRGDFEENVETRYLPRALALIEGGYRWLVHAQKPASSIPVRPPLPVLHSGPGRHRTQSEWD